MDIDDYIKCLADTCYQVYEEMTQQQVSSIKIDKIDPPFTDKTYKMAIVIPYENKAEKFEGKFVLGFNNEAMAVKLASTIASLLGMPVSSALDDTATDILFEFMNTVAGKVITGWDKLGLAADFFPPQFIADFGCNDHYSNETSVYAVSLNLEKDKIAILVYFEENETNPLKGKKILVVDDSKMIRFVVTREFEKQGCQVSQAENGLEAVIRTQAMNPDLILMDLVMPKMGGLEAIAKIREISPLANIIILTSSSKEQEVRTAASYKVKGYVKKPIQMVQLLRLAAHCFEAT